MYKTESTIYGFRITFSGSIKPDEMNAWLSESEEMLKEKANQKFQALIDLRDLIEYNEESLKIIERGQRVFKHKGMERSAVIIKNNQIKNEFQKMGKLSNIIKSERYIDASVNPNWEQTSMNWITKGIDPVKKINMRLREKLSAIVGGTIFTVLSLLGFFIYDITLENTKAMVESELTGKVRLVKGMVQSSIDISIKTHLRAIADKNVELAKYYYTRSKRGMLSEQDAFERFKNTLLSNDSDYGKIGVTGYIAGLSSQGIAKIHPKAGGMDLSKHEFVQKAIKMKNGFLEYKWKNKDEELERDKVGYLSYFEPWDIIIWASSYKEEFNDLVKVGDFKDTVRNIVIGKTGYVYILDAKGKLIVHKKEELVGQNYFTKTDSNGMYFIQEIIKRKEGHLSYLWKEDDNAKPKEKLIFFSHIPEMDWYVVAGSNSEEFYDSLSVLRNIIIFATIFSFIVLFGILTFSLSRLLKPFAEVKQVVNSFAEGDLTRKIEVNSQDEIGEVSSYFNLIIDNFNELIHKLKEYTSTLLGSTQNLSVTAKEISATSNTQAAAVREIVSTMEDSNTLAKQISISISEVNKISNQTKENVETGVSFIQSSLEKMTEIKSKNKETIVGIKALGEKIESIWEIVNIINGIVDQTKIIAFNAALEASSAGEAGKNFQIVASEIKRLADNTMISTKEIKGRISEIQNSSNNLIIISEEGSERVKEGWELSNKLEEVFNEILNSAEISAKSAGQIDMSIKQQVSSFEQILLTLKEISGGIENFVISTKNTSQASESLNKIATDLRKIIDKYTV